MVPCLHSANRRMRQARGNCKPRSNSIFRCVRGRELASGRCGSICDVLISFPRRFRFQRVEAALRRFKMTGGDVDLHNGKPGLQLEGDQRGFSRFRSNSGEVVCRPDILTGCSADRRRSDSDGQVQTAVTAFQGEFFGAFDGLLSLGVSVFNQ